MGFYSIFYKADDNVWVYEMQNAELYFDFYLWKTELVKCSHAYKRTKSHNRSQREMKR